MPRLTLSLERADEAMVETNSADKDRLHIAE